MTRKVIALTIAAVLVLSIVPPDLSARAEDGPPVINRIYLKAERDADNRVTHIYEIYGELFLGSRVYIDDEEILPSHITESNITIRRAEGIDDIIFRVGPKNIRIINEDNQTAQTVFDVKAPPHITSVSTNKVYVGEPLVIYGTGFGDVTRVWVAGESYLIDVDATIDSDGRRIEIHSVKAPAVYGVTDVRVNKNAGPDTDTSIPREDVIEGALKNCISVVGKLDDIEVVSLEPDSGHVSGGTVIRMMGNVKDGKSGFTPDMRVLVGGAEASGVQVITSDTGQVIGLQAVTPPGEAGECQVLIQDAEGHNEYILPQKFTYVQASNMLVVTGVSPSFAKESQQQEIFVSGRNIATLNIGQLQEVIFSSYKGYDPIDNIYIVEYTGTYNDQPVTIERRIKLTVGDIAPISEITKRQINGDEIRATTPVITLTEEGKPEVYDVVVDTETIVTYADGGGQAIHRVERYTLNNAFTYMPDKTIPEIHGITPIRGPWDQDIYISIKGANFQVLTEETDGGQTTRYPVITVGPREINPNENPDGPKVRVYDSEGNLLDGKKYTLGTEIRTVIPAGIAVEGYVNVSITNPDEGFDMAENLFRFMDPQSPDIPRIDRLEPNIGATGGGTQVKIYGDNFDNDINQLIVTIDGAEAQVIDVRSLGNEITIITPPGEEGYRTVQVINGDGSMATLEDGYYYTRVSSDPVIYSIAPDIGSEGTKVIIRGRDFRPRDGDSEVLENKLGTRVLLDGQDINDYLLDEDGNIMLDTDGNIMFDDDGDRTRVLDEYTIEVTIPPGHYTGYKDVTVLNPDTANHTVINGFYYGNPTIHPEITGIDPGEGTVDGGTVVTLYGSSFWEEIRVFFGGYEATNVTVSGNGDMLQATTPAYYISGQGVKSEKVDVTVVNYNGGSDTLEDGFTYMIPDSVPLITGIEPGWGSTAGEDTVTVFGRDFQLELKDGEISRLPEVYFGGVKAVSVRWDSHNRLTVITPAYPNAGSVDVTVINPDAGIYTARDAFEYRRSSPGITSVTPDRGSRLGGQEITIKGSGFVKGDLSEHYQGEQVDRDTNPGNPVIDQLVVFGDDRDSAFISGGVAEVAVGDIRVEYDSRRLGNNTTLVYIPSSGPEVPVASYNIGMGKYHLFIINGQEDLDNPDLADEAIRVDVTQNEVTVTRRIAPYARWINEGTIAVRTPPVSFIGERNLYVINKDGGTATSTFHYMSPDSNPQIYDISPKREMYGPDGKIGGYVTEGGVDAETYVTIYGEDFRTGVKVFVDDIEAEVISKSNDDRQLIVKVPPGSEGYIGRLLDIVVLNLDGGSAKSSLMPVPHWFEYKRPESNPEIHSVNPGRTSAAGGNRIEIEGYDFRPGIKVIIGGVEAVGLQMGQWPYRLISVLTPEGLSAGPCDVQVINPDFGSATLRDALTIISYPRIGYITNESGNVTDSIPVMGGSTIILKGQDFHPGARVVFGGEIIPLDGAAPGQGIPGLDASDRDVAVVGGTAPSGVEVVDGNTIRLVVPAGVEGDTTIVVINPDGGVSEEYPAVYKLPIPGAPDGLDISLVYDRYVRLEWPVVEDALYYEIYAREGTRGEFHFIASTTRTVYYIIDLDSDTRYYFRVKAINRFGSSEFTSQRSIRTDDTRERDTDGYINEEEKILVNGNTVTVNIPDNALTSEYYYNIDLSGPDYSGAVQRTVNVPLAVIRGGRGTFALDAGDIMLQFSPSALNAAPLWSVSTSNRDSAYGRITLGGAGSDGERARKYLPARHTVVSGLYCIGLSAVKGKTEERCDAFNGSLNIRVKYQGSLPQGIGESSLMLYRFDPAALRWEGVDAAGTDVVSGFAYGRITAPGIYAVLGQ